MYGVCAEAGGGAGFQRIWLRFSTSSTSTWAAFLSRAEAFESRMTVALPRSSSAARQLAATMKTQVAVRSISRLYFKRTITGRGRARSTLPSASTTLWAAAAIVALDFENVNRNRLGFLVKFGKNTDPGTAATPAS